MSSQDPRLVRIQKIIADSGYCSRRAAEKLILEGRVELNGRTVLELGTKADPVKDTIFVDGDTIDPSQVTKVYLLMNKPRGYMTTLSDPEGRRTVLDLIPEISERVYPVGRLDYLSEGLLLMTNDGELSNKILHPKFGVEKIYEVKVFGRVTKELLFKLQEGTVIDGRLAKPESVRVVGQLFKKTWLEFRLTEGRNREIRKICDAAGIVIDKLKRVAIEGLSVEGIAPGNYKFITKRDLLKKLGMNEDGERLSGEGRKFYSAKRTLRIDGKIRMKKNERHRQRRVRKDDVKSANDPFFGLFKKESYYKSLEVLKNRPVPGTEEAPKSTPGARKD